MALQKTRKIKKMYWPRKYFKGLSRKKATERKKEIMKFGQKKTNGAHKLQQ